MIKPISQRAAIAPRIQLTIPFQKAARKGLMGPSTGFHNLNSGYKCAAREPHRARLGQRPEMFLNKVICV